MSIVTLVSGGLDSTVMAVVTKRAGITQHPLFVDYGQLSGTKERSTCVSVFEFLGLPTPRFMNLSGFGELVPSGITNRNYDINNDAFLPGRNLLLLLAGAAYASRLNVGAVAMGLLDDEYAIFPDQTESFIEHAEQVIATTFGFRIQIVVPLMQFNKAQVLQFARDHGITGTYSCHSGGAEPCGHCISCKEITSAKGVRE